MRAALAALLLLALAPVQAQLVLEKPKPAAKEKAAAKPATKPDSAQPAEPQRKRHSTHPPAQRPPETRETSEGTVKLDRARPQPNRQQTTPPSPAQQYQQQQYEQRQPAQTQRRQNEPAQNRVVQCTARPVCGGAGYGRCAAVSQTFPGATLQGGRREIVQRCIEANIPDSCNCAAQCTAVARCSIF